MVKFLKCNIKSQISSEQWKVVFYLIKVIPKAKIDKKNQGKMFFEFQLLKNIDHPHIIRIYEVYNDQKNLYLITEYILMM